MTLFGIIYNICRWYDGQIRLNPDNIIVFLTGDDEVNKQFEELCGENVGSLNTTRLWLNFNEFHLKKKIIVILCF